MKVRKITNHVGRQFNIELSDHTEPNDRTVKIYDATYANRRGYGPLGQFVCDYRYTSLNDIPEGRGLNLHMGVPEWQLDSFAFERLMSFAYFGN